MNKYTHYPYPSRRMPVFAANVVTTSQPLAAQAGLQMLKNGGNAVDAALAAAMVLTVVEPTSNGIGSDAFAMVWDGHTLNGINGSGCSPKAWRADHFKHYQDMPDMGWDSVTVPGAVHVWSSLSRRFGKLDFIDLMQPAVQYARHGFIITPLVALQWADAAERFKNCEDFTRSFLIDGRAPQTSDLFRFPEQADTLLEIGETHGESFYQGDLARRISDHSFETGGCLSLEDLAEHTSLWVQPLSIDYGDITLHELPPNGQGLSAMIALGILKHFNLGQFAMDSADSIHLQIEAMKIAIGMAFDQIADPASMAMDPYRLIGEDLLASQAAQIEMGSAKTLKSVRPTKGGTVYLATADSTGMMVSYIQSNYDGFGSGIVIPGTGISMQNRAHGFTLEKDHPNRVDGGKRPFHTIIPAFISRQGSPLMSLGVMGGHMQPQGHVQTIVRMVDYGLNPQAALDSPRWHVFEDHRVALEVDADAKIITELKRRGHVIEPAPLGTLFGGGQIIERLENGHYCAASDPRKDGQAVGF